jgi:endonuclease/exonuclease/phosphatase (EEP) superfamily protein YafD
VSNKLLWRRGGVKPNDASNDGHGATVQNTTVQTATVQNTTVQTATVQTPLEDGTATPPIPTAVNPPAPLEPPDAAGDDAAPTAVPAESSGVHGRRWAWVRGFAVGLTLAYCGALLVLVLVLRFIGEGWWVTTTLLYLPRIVFALPLPFVAAGLLVFGTWRQILCILPVPILLLLFPLMDLHLGIGSTFKTARAAESTSQQLRVLSFNVAAGDFAKSTAATILAANADVILMQEWDARVANLVEPALPHFHRSVNHQFGVLSRYPILDVYLPSLVPYLENNDLAARYARYRIQTPAGVVTILNVHPISPRKGLERFRRFDLRALVKAGGLGGDEGVALLRRNAAMRWEQADEIATAAKRATGPVIIAGDTNLPALSRIYGETLADFRDGFSAVGRGFGYTYPAHQPWMRIDRVLATSSLRFLRFEVLPPSGSDHRAVVADLALP